MSTQLSSERRADAEPGAEPSPVAGLVETFCRLDDRLARLIAIAQADREPGGNADAFRGLYLTTEDACRTARQKPGNPFDTRGVGDRESPVNAIVAFEPNSPFEKLKRIFRLSAFDIAAVVVALAPEFDLKYEKIYGYLHDDVSRRRPSVDLTLSILCRDGEERLARRGHFAPDSQLVQSRMVRLIAENPNASSLSQAIRLDDQIARFLLQQRGLDPRLASFCRLSRPGAPQRSPTSSLPERTVRWLWVSVVRSRKERRPFRMFFHGVPCTGQEEVAATLAYESGTAILRIDLRRWPSGPGVEADELVRVVLREALFQGALLYVEPWDVLFDTAGGRHSLRDVLPAELAEFNGVAILAGERPWEPLPRGPVGVLSVDFAMPPYEVRWACWKAAAATADLPMGDDLLDSLAGLYRLGPGQIADAVATLAASFPAGDRFTEPSSIDMEAYFRAARSQSGHELSRLARRVDPVHGWDDLVLEPDVRLQLREMCDHIRHKRQVREEWGFGRRVARNSGTSALFSGPSGTGKTTAASIIAREMHLEMFEIDLSQVVSKYIGETEQNLRKIFDAAVNSNAILQFNEADALWGKRSEVRDAHDRYANLEIAFLLQEMERFDGVAILTTNLRQNLDESFTRRLDFVVEISFPDEAARRKIWEVLLPPEAPREQLDLDLLARMKLSGGNIKNVVYAGAFYAAASDRKITTRDLVRAARREYQKLGRLVDEAGLGEFGEAAEP